MSHVEFRPAAPRQAILGCLTRLSSSTRQADTIGGAESITPCAPRPHAGEKQRSKENETGARMTPTSTLGPRACVIMHNTWSSHQERRSRQGGVPQSRNQSCRPYLNCRRDCMVSGLDTSCFTNPAAVGSVCAIPIPATPDIQNFFFEYVCTDDTRPQVVESRPASRFLSTSHVGGCVDADDFALRLLGLYTNLIFRIPVFPTFFSPPLPLPPPFLLIRLAFSFFPAPHALPRPTYLTLSPDPPTHHYQRKLASPSQPARLIDSI
ncbi:hypothetical protein R3P38DRAFT_3233967 [Favolaschia claudopus]|uniref:Uncharacterized protein n=1 Tax=Favolaschia claudopus TaxID=2862362 RepID=A0AAV9ZGK0_9AGAR